MNAPPISMNPISMSFGNPPNSQSNNTSPFASFENNGYPKLWDSYTISPNGWAQLFVTAGSPPSSIGYNNEYLPLL